MTNRIYQDEDGMWVFPDGVCQTVTDSNVGYGPDIEVPCGADGTFTVKYDLFIPYDPETGETDIWTECTEVACDDHRGQMLSYAEEHPEEMRITEVTRNPDSQLDPDNLDHSDTPVEEVISANKGMDWYAWYKDIENGANPEEADMRAKTDN